MHVNMFSFIFIRLSIPLGMKARRIVVDQLLRRWRTKPINYKIIVDTTMEVMEGISISKIGNARKKQLNNVK